MSSRRPTRSARTAFARSSSTARATGSPSIHQHREAEPFAMCRNIRTLFNFEPPASELEVRDASLQFVRKLSGFSVPSKANEAAFDAAVEQIAAAARMLIGSLVTSAEPRDRDVEAERARARTAARFGTPPRRQGTSA